MNKLQHKILNFLFKHKVFFVCFTIVVVCFCLFL